MALLTGKVVLVSGGTQGVGAAIVRACVAADAEAVVFTGRNEQRGRSLEAELTSGSSQVAFVRTDLADLDQALASAAETIERFGRIDCLVNNAGLVTRGTLLETSPELFDQHIAINLKAPFFLMQAAVRDMRARTSPGAIVNILTTSMHGGQPMLAAYVASKAGLAGATKNAAHAHRFDRIRINGLNIGWTLTEGEDAIQRSAHGAADGWHEQAAARLPMGKLGEPKEIADMVVFLLSDRSGVVTGSIIDWDQNVIGALD